MGVPFDGHALGIVTRLPGKGACLDLLAQCHRFKVPDVHTLTVSRDQLAVVLALHGL